MKFEEAVCECICAPVPDAELAMRRCFGRTGDEARHAAGYGSQVCGRLRL